MDLPKAGSDKAVQFFDSQAEASRNKARKQGKTNPGIYRRTECEVKCQRCVNKISLDQHGKLTRRIHSRQNRQQGKSKPNQINPRKANRLIQYHITDYEDRIDIRIAEEYEIKAK